MVTTRHYVLLCLSCLAASCKPQSPYSITAQIPDCNECQATLWFKNGNESIAVDSGIVHGTQLQLAGSIREAGIYELTYAKHAVHAIALYLPLDTATVHIKPLAQAPRRFAKLYLNKKLGSHLREYHVQSSAKAQAELEAYLFNRDSMWNKYFTDKDLLTAVMVQTFDSHDDKLIKQWTDSANGFSARFPDYLFTGARAFVRQYPRSVIAPYALLTESAGRSDTVQLVELYRRLTTAQRSSIYGQLLSQRVPK